MEPIPLLEKVSSYSLLARLWLLDEPSFFSLAGYDRANNIIVLCYQFSTVAPQVLLSFKTKLAEEKQNVTIACNVTGQPQPDIKWSKSGGTMPKSRNGVKNGVLTIYNVAETDRGTYVCKAKNILGHDFACGIFSSALQNESSSRGDSLYVWFNCSFALCGRK